MSVSWSLWSFCVAIVAIILGVAMMILGLVWWNNKLLASGFGLVMFGLYLLCHGSGQSVEQPMAPVEPFRMNLR